MFDADGTPQRPDGRAIRGDYYRVNCPRCDAICNCLVAEIDGHDHYCWKCHTGFQPDEQAETEDTDDFTPGAFPAGDPT